MASSSRSRHYVHHEFWVHQFWYFRKLSIWDFLSSWEKSQPEIVLWQFSCDLSWTMDYYIRNLYYQLTKLEHPNFKWRQVFPSNEVDLPNPAAVKKYRCKNCGTLFITINRPGWAGHNTRLRDLSMVHLSWSLTQTCGLIVMLIYRRLINTVVCRYNTLKSLFNH